MCETPWSLIRSRARSMSIWAKRADRIKLILWAGARGVSFRLDFRSQSAWLTMQNGASFENVLPIRRQTAAASFRRVAKRDDVRRCGRRTRPRLHRIGRREFHEQHHPTTLGLYVEFHSSGRCDPGTIIFSDTDGAVIEIGCLAGTRRHHVLTDDEGTSQSRGVTAAAGLRSSTDEHLPHQSLSFRDIFPVAFVMRHGHRGSRAHRSCRHIAPDFDRSAVIMSGISLCAARRWPSMQHHAEARIPAKSKLNELIATGSWPTQPSRRFRHGQCPGKPTPGPPS